MAKPKYFSTLTGDKIPLPVFFPDATRAVLKTLDSTDIVNSHTPGVLVNTYHLHLNPGQNIISAHGGIRPFMNWSGGVISDSGGFQVMSLAKTLNSKKAVTDAGVTFKDNGKKILFTPEMSIRMQMELAPDMVVVLDDFTDLDTTYEKARETVYRTLLWAKQCKQIFEKVCQEKKLKTKPYLLGVVQGGEYLDLRTECTQELVKIGFDGLGYGGWPMKKDGSFNYDVAQVIRDNTPDDCLLYALGIGMPQDIVNMVKIGWHIFDCVLPTRDARHHRLYTYNSRTVDKIDLSDPNFYSFFTPDKDKYLSSNKPVSTACDCHLCTNYSRGYLAHLFKIKEMTAGRLATIHNLRFYSILMEKLRKNTDLPYS